jgi:hypothetical protein
MKGISSVWNAIAIIGFLCTILFIVMAIIGAIKKNGTAKKRFLWAFIGFVAFMVGAVNSPPSEKQAMTNTTETSVKKEDGATSKEAEKKANADAKKKADEDAKAEVDAKAKADAEAKAPRIGDTVAVGNFSVAVSTPKQSPTIGDRFLNQKANGIYWVIPVAVRNDDKEARTVDSSMFELVSGSGIKYEPDSTAAMYANSDSDFFLKKINPGITIKGYIVFDMPTDQKVEEYKMQVRGGVGFKTTNPVDVLLKQKQ